MRTPGGAPEHPVDHNSRASKRQHPQARARSPSALRVLFPACEASQSTFLLAAVGQHRPDPATLPKAGHRPL